VAARPADRPLDKRAALLCRRCERRRTGLKGSRGLMEPVYHAAAARTILRAAGSPLHLGSQEPQPCGTLLEDVRQSGKCADHILEGVAQGFEI